MVTGLLFLPGLTCLLWIFIHVLLASHTNTFKVLVLLLSMIVLSSAADIVMEILWNSEALPMVVIQLTTPTLLPLSWLFLASLDGNFKMQPGHLLWIIIPVALFSVSLIIVIIDSPASIDELLVRIQSADKVTPDLFRRTSERAYYICSQVILSWVLMAESLYFTFYIVRLAYRRHFSFRQLFGFFFRGRKISVLHLQIFVLSALALMHALKFVLHAHFFNSHQWFSVLFALLLSILFFTFAMNALFSSREYLSLSDLPTALRFNYNRETRVPFTQAVVRDMLDGMDSQVIAELLPRHEERDLAASVLGNAYHPDDQDSLLYRFQHLMRDEQLFLQPGLMLTEVADRLGSNKTYVSKLVNQTYKKGFPEVLNILRVDYAQRYIPAHPGASQEEIAKACGFLSASSFNSTFKRITGLTPKVWAARQEL